MSSASPGEEARRLLKRIVRGLPPVQAIVRRLAARELRGYLRDPEPDRRSRRARRLVLLARASATEIDLGADLAGFRLVFPSRSDIGMAIASGKPAFDALPGILGAAVSAAPPVVCEVGSNLGATLLQLLHGRPDARVYAFEPSPRYLPYLRRNVEVNGLRGVTVVDRLVSDRPGRARISSNTTTATAVTDAEYSGLPSVGTAEVAATTLDEFFADGPSVDFLKIDTDGFDFIVLLGARKLLERDRPTLYFELAPELMRSAGRDPADLFPYLASVDYGPFGVLSNQGEPLGAFATGEEIFELYERFPHRDYPYFDIVASGRGAPPVGELLGSRRP